MANSMPLRLLPRRSRLGFTFINPATPVAGFFLPDHAYAFHLGIGLKEGFRIYIYYEYLKIRPNFIWQNTLGAGSSHAPPIANCREPRNNFRRRGRGQVYPCHLWSDRRASSQSRNCGLQVCPKHEIWLRADQV